MKSYDQWRQQQELTTPFPANSWQFIEPLDRLHRYFFGEESRILTSAITQMQQSGQVNYALWQKVFKLKQMSQEVTKGLTNLENWIRENHQSQQEKSNAHRQTPG